MSLVNGANPNGDKVLYRYPEGFVVMSVALAGVLVDGALSRQALRVLGVVLSRCGRDNRLEETQARVAELLGMAPSNVSAAFSELALRGLVVRMHERTGRRYWCLDARFGFRGSAARHAVVLRRQREQRERLAQEAA